jgi:anti-anti-sigma factor
VSLAQLRTKPDATLPHAWITGEIDLSNAARLAGELSALVPNTALGLVVDLSGVTYLDSSGISVLFAVGSRLRDRGQYLRLLVPETALIRRPLTIAGISTIAELVPA